MFAAIETNIYIEIDAIRLKYEKIHIVLYSLRNSALYMHAFKLNLEIKNISAYLCKRIKKAYNSM